MTIQNIKNRARLPENPEVNNALATQTRTTENLTKRSNRLYKK